MKLPSAKAMVWMLRPQQWVKNLFVLLPLFFGERLLDAVCWRQSLGALVAMCMASSAVYCLNDIVDADLDRRHPHKRMRPLASGAVSPAWAWVLVATCIGGCVAAVVLWPVGRNAAAAIAAYLVLNTLYCLWLKHVAIIDVVCVAFGFVLRVVAGGLACGISVSEWIIMMTFLLALLLAISKRRYDVLLMQGRDALSRPSAGRYSVEFLNVAVGTIAAVTVVCYIMYCVSPAVTSRLHSPYLYVSALFVVAGILRYLQQTTVNSDNGCDPTHILLHDRFIQLCIVCWAIYFVVVIYL